MSTSTTKDLCPTAKQRVMFARSVCASVERVALRTMSTGAASVPEIRKVRVPSEAGKAVPLARRPIRRLA